MKFGKEKKEEWGRAKRKPCEVTFREPQDGEVLHEGHVTPNKESDYIVRDGEGRIFAVDKAVFLKLFDIIKPCPNERRS